MTRKTIASYFAGVFCIIILSQKGFSQTVTYASPLTYGVGSSVTLTPTISGFTPAANAYTATYAGNGTAGSGNGTAPSVSFNQPLGIAVDAQGNVYVADANSDLIRKITAGGVVTTLAGSGARGSSNGQGTAATFYHPVGLAVDASGNVYVADEENNMIRKITPSGLVSTLAGSTTASANDGLGTAAGFNAPCGVALDVANNVYVADYSNNKIRKITPAGQVSTYAGTGAVGATNSTLLASTFNHPFSVVFDNSGNLYIADRVNQMIRKITPAGTVSTFAGNGTAGFVDNASGTAAELNGPTEVTSDGTNIYVTDETNLRIRKITAAGYVTTLAGTGTLSSNNGIGNVSTFNDPFGIAADPKSGLLYEGDYSNLIRTISYNNYSISPNISVPGLNFDPSTGIISGTPTSATPLSNYNIMAYYSGGVITSNTFSITIQASGVYPSVSENYIMTSSPRVNNITSNAALTIASGDPTQVQVGIQYIDGLGRTEQTVEVKGSGDATKDIVTPVYYDIYGRESQKYLPYADGTSAAGSYKANALYANAGVTTYYNPPTGTTPPVGVVQTPFPYGQTNYEPTPLNRVIEQGAPGDNWQTGTPTGSTNPGHTIKTDYETNIANTIVQYEAEVGTVSGQEYMSTLSNLGYYAAGDLYITITYNENWVSANGKTGTTEIYKDKDGKVILTRVYDTGAAPRSTYYVYDYRGNLSFVFPPGVSPDTSTPGQAALDNFCYQYRYDGRGRMIEKKLPGRGWDYLVYNTQDQVVMTQDPNKRANNQWLFTKYDLLGRPVISGIYTCTAANNTRVIQQGAVTSQTVYGETQDNSAGTGYTNTAYPNSGTIQYLTVSYYDNYTWPGASGLTAQSAYQSTTYNKVTGSKVYTLDGSTSYLTANYYDIEGRLIESMGQNQLNGSDRVVNTYDFTGNLKTSYRTHVGNGATTTVSTGYTYDHMGRKRQTTESINGATAAIISQIDYNDIGQPYKKHLHSTNNGTSFLQDITYSYNERGWLTKANGGTNSLFNLELRYNSPDAGITANYNGNISEMLYYDAYTNTNKTFNYTYDPLNRLTISVSTGGILNETVTYDPMGNISTLARGTGIPASMTYNYTNPSPTDGGPSNQLFSVSDPTHTNNNRTYLYDDNGNAKSDGMGKTITYNILDLPKSVSAVGAPGTIIATYNYDASGRKLSNTGSDGTWVYDNGIVYNSQTYTSATPIDFIQTEEGRAVRNTTNGTYSYEYNLKDQLGNVRVSFNTGSNGLAQIIQKDDYYAFGLKATGEYIGATANRYLYNGKEIQTDLTNQYDYGARFYDPVIARWNTIDPLAEKSRRWSPYTYVMNDPIRMTDPDGREGDPGNGDWDRVDYDDSQYKVETMHAGVPGLYLAAQDGPGPGDPKGGGSGKTGGSTEVGGVTHRFDINLNVGIQTPAPNSSGSHIDWGGATNAFIGMVGGVAEAGLGVLAVETGIGALAIGDGGSRAFLNGARLFGYLSGHNDIGDSLPANFGAIIGKAIDNDNGVYVNQVGAFQTVFGGANDVATMLLFHTNWSTPAQNAYAAFGGLISDTYTIGYYYNKLFAQ